MARYAMLIDMTRCIGCDACTVACKQENGTPVDTFFARVINIEAGKYPAVKRFYLPILCNHCDDAPCLKACPNKAIFRRDDGIVLIDQDRCKGTGACVSACPYGNVYLQKVDRWYLEDDMEYETKHVRPRLKENVARKCTYCAHRVDKGLDPACVVACPTTARIFGDLEDDHSAISRYIVEEAIGTGREPFHLLPECKTNPATCYLGPMSEQETATLHGGTEEAFVGIGVTEIARPAVHATRPMSVLKKVDATGLLTESLSLFKKAFIRITSLLGLTLLVAAVAMGQGPKTDVFSTSNCVGCHGAAAMGGLGPPLAKTKITDAEFQAIVRKGKGMMPAFSADALSDSDLNSIRDEVRLKPWLPDQVPLTYKIGSLLTPQKLSIYFLFVFGFAFLFGLKVLWYWVDCTGIRQARPYLRKFGTGKAALIALRAMIVDGFLVASLFRRSPLRWFMHGLILYGFCGLMLADILIAIYNPMRAELPLGSALKVLPLVSGLAVFIGILYVKYRYQKDEFIDNGVTLGRDFLFVNLLFHTILSGFFVFFLARLGGSAWILTIYLYHLSSITLLIATAPFTRFSHAWVVPALVAVTRGTEALTESGVEIGYRREPSPGRHHKTDRIARQVVDLVDPVKAKTIVIRYYP